MAGIELAASAMGLTSLIMNDVAILNLYMDASAELSELKNEVQSVQALLRLFLDHGLGNLDNKNLIDEVLVGLEKTLGDLQALLDKYSGVLARKARMDRIRWVLKDRDRAMHLKKRLDDYNLRLGLLLTAFRPTSQPNEPKNEEILIAVMGETGSGKSSLIQKVTASEDVKVGHSLESETQIVQTYSIMIGARRVTLIDTPGFDDTSRSDIDVLNMVSSWLSKSYQSRKLLSGIIYLHPITATRMRGSARKNLDIFTALIGPGAFGNIFLVTTMWDLLPDPSIGERREDQLRETFWKGLIDKGSITARSYGNRKSALAVLNRVAFDQRTAQTNLVPLEIQREMVDEHKTLSETAAGEALIERMNRMEIEHAGQIDRLKREMEAEYKKQMAQLKQELMGQHSAKNASDVYQSFTVEQLLGDQDPPPPYTPKTRSPVLMLLLSLWYYLIFALTPMFELHRFLEHKIARYLRHKLQKDHSRIEWKCSCGDILYGDYIEMTPGSLHTLASKLDGKVISGPATLQSASQTSSSSPQVPQAAHLRGGSTSAAASRSTGNIVVPNQQNTRPGGPQTIPGRTVGRGTQSTTVNPRWLELCIRSGPNTYVQSEIDLSTLNSDQAVFSEIRRHYNSNRVTARWLGQLAYRVPAGGIAVEFLKDKLATPRSSPTASIILSPSMPDEVDALRYNYVFRPIPMDKQPIDLKTFRHYFSKPHLADPLAVWIDRFPVLHDTSLYWKPEKLAKGWGFEIVESRNWMLAGVLGMIGIAMSAIAAGVSSWVMKDKATGVAIGGLLIATQTLVYSFMFWHWTN